jgi:hypothetical protein
MWILTIIPTIALGDTEARVESHCDADGSQGDQDCIANNHAGRNVLRIVDGRHEIVPSNGCSTRNYEDQDQSFSYRQRLTYIRSNEAFPAETQSITVGFVRPKVSRLDFGRKQTLKMGRSLTDSIAFLL